MTVFGDLSSMSVSDLLQWVGSSGKTGTLELERQGVRTRIHFRKGRLTACSSEDPPNLLGQFLLSRGKITTAQLREGLSRQETSGENLGRILVEMGALTAGELKQHLAAKAEETIFGLFDWPDASFRFLDETPPDPYGIEVDLLIEDVLLHGMKRLDEMGRLRKVFPDPNLVLKQTGRKLPPEVANLRAAAEIFDSIDGKKSLAEVLLHAHATEYVALRFLQQLLKGGLIAIASPSAEPDSAQASPRGAGRREPPAPSGKAAAAVAEAAAAAAPAANPGVGARIAEALSRLSEGDPDAALEHLVAAYREHPGEPSLRELIGKAEAACREAALRIVGPAKIPVIVARSDSPARQGLSPVESYLLTVIDGQNDVRSILWVAPLREFDVLRGLKRLHERGVVKFR